jgi:hypothetical protein
MTEIPSFIKAKELKKEYITYGLYDNIKNPTSRSLLIIKKKDSEDKDRYDCVFIMMNPGSSSPILNGIKYGNLVEAKPDVAQYQIMRIMERSNWSFVAVLNLSDIIEPKSKRLFSKLKLDIHSNQHSIFSKNRCDELRQILSKTNKVCCAWGLNEQLSPLIQLAWPQLNGQMIFGYQSFEAQRDGHYYYHPSPPCFHGKQDWLQHIDVS